MLLKKQTPSLKKKDEVRLAKKVAALANIKDKEVDFEDAGERPVRVRRPKQEPVEVEDIVSTDSSDEDDDDEDEDDIDPMLRSSVPGARPRGRPRKDPNETTREKAAKRKAEVAARRAAKAIEAGVDPEELKGPVKKNQALIEQAEAVIASNVVVFDSAITGGKISKLGVRARRTIIGGSAEDIHQLIEHGHTDAATSLIYKKLLQSVVDTLPYMELVIRKSRGYKGAYAYNSMVSSVREIMTDIQQSQDRGRQGEALVERIILPVFLDIGMMMMREFEAIGQKMRRDNKLDEDTVKVYLLELDECQHRIGSQLQMQLKEVRDECRKFLQR